MAIRPHLFLAFVFCYLFPATLAQTGHAKTSFPNRHIIRCLRANVKRPAPGPRARNMYAAPSAGRFLRILLAPNDFT
jgi:hypothetical protein